jgi:hypothetical protein
LTSESAPSVRLLKERAQLYHDQCARVGRGHYSVGESLGKAHLRLGIAVVSLTALVATAVFADISHVSNPALKIAVGLLSGLATILAALQTFLTLEARSSKHKEAGARYGAIRRDLDLFLLRLDCEGPQLADGLSRLTDLAARLGQLAEESPHLPARYFLSQQSPEMRRQP